GSKAKRSQGVDLGGTLRVGLYPCELAAGSIAQRAYGEARVSERHRHRYEFNAPQFGERASEIGITVSGLSPDGALTEIIERRDHPWFVAVQFHPEFKSRPLKGHPLFVSFVKGAVEYRAAQTTKAA
ncbi:MAG: CTP synthetase, partial [Holosporales bacterium]|nr:CTP synthetase [Holosporales bacterium]